MSLAPLDNGPHCQAREEGSVPRLSIIVPHRHNDARLEMTLLSLLENRPHECEIIVVHDGSYSNTYHLEDEVLFIAEQGTVSTARLLNAGVMAACAPVVGVVLDGTLVSAGWSDSALHLLISSQCSAVAVGLRGVNASTAVWGGVDSRLLQRGAAAQSGRLLSKLPSQSCLGPSLSCGFYRRRVLLSLTGWNEELDEQLLDVELALALAACGITCACDSQATVAVSAPPQPRKLSTTAVAQLSSLLVAHGAVAPGWQAAWKGLLADCLQGRLVSGWAWAAGLRDASTIRRTQLRLNHARQQLNNLNDRAELRVFGDATVAPQITRRAA